MTDHPDFPPLTQVELDHIAADIVATLPNMAPTEAQAIRMQAALDAHKDTAEAFRMQMLFSACLHVEDQMKAHPELDKNALMRVLTTDLLWLTFFIARSVKRADGEDLDPARMALLAYETAQAMRAIQWDDRFNADLRGENGSLREWLERRADEEDGTPP